MTSASSRRGTGPHERDLADAWFSDQRGPAPPQVEDEDIATLAKNLELFQAHLRHRMKRVFAALGKKDGLTLASIPALLHHDAPGLPGYVDPRILLERLRLREEAKKAEEAEKSGGAEEPGSGAEPRGRGGRAGQGRRRVRNPKALVPQGIVGFVPNDAIREGFTSAFREKKSIQELRAILDAPLPGKPLFQSVLLVGTLGTLGYSPGDPRTIWLVGDFSSLDPILREALVARVEAIRRWAARERAFPIFLDLIDSRWLRGQVSSLKPRDPMLLELGPDYAVSRLCNALPLMGRVPLWWLVPGDWSRKKVGAVLSRVRENSGVLGPVPPMDFGVRVGPGLRMILRMAVREIDQALQKPFDAVIRLVLIRSMMADERDSLPGSSFKEEIHTGLVQADPYISDLNRAHRFLAEQNEWASFRFLQKCFYLKLGLHLSSGGRSKIEFREQMNQIQSYVERWGWDKDLVQELDNIESWNVERVQRFGENLRDLLLKSYQEVVEAIRARGLEDDQVREETNWLGRKLTSIISPKPYKIERLFTYFLNESLAEERLTIREPRGVRRQWELLRGAPKLGRLDHLATTPLVKRATVLEVLVWMIHNRIYGSRTALSITSRGELPVQAIKTMLRRLARHFQDGPDIFAREYTSFQDAPAKERAFLVVNFDSSDPFLRGGVYYLAEHWDVLSYSRRRASLVKDVAVVWRNTWGELFLRRFEGMDAIVRSMELLLDGLPSRVAPLLENLDVFCLQQRWATIIPRRLKQTFSSIREILCADADEPEIKRRFVVEVAGRAVLVDRVGDRFSVRSPDDSSAFWRALELVPSGSRLELAVDPQSLAMGMLGAVVSANRFGRIQVFTQSGRGHAMLLVLDENGALYREMLKPGRLSSRGLELGRFLAAYATRLGGVLVDRLRFGELVPDGRQERSWIYVDRTDAMFTSLEEDPAYDLPPLRLLVAKGMLTLETDHDHFDLLEQAERRRALHELMAAGYFTRDGHLLVSEVIDANGQGAVRQLRWVRVAERLLLRGGQTTATPA